MNLKPFSEKNYNKQAPIFNHLLALLAVQIFCTGLGTLKIIDSFTGLILTL